MLPANNLAFILSPVVTFELIGGVIALVRWLTLPLLLLIIVVDVLWASHLIQTL